ncbi:MAG: TetR/AcrR family transcriptional regulator [Microbacteriaceae bacterium]|nr:TetR/AcrR family transcriptional regulator [Microbacteriaceae bacterium]
MAERTVQRRDAERTKSRLLTEAMAAFAETGYTGTGVDEIAARTGTTKRMIYYYFGSKEGLYQAVLERAYRGIREAEQSIVSANLDPIESVRHIAQLTFDHHLEHQDFIRLVAIENIHRGRTIRGLESLRELNAPALGVLEQALDRGRADGVFRDDVTALDMHLLISSYCVFQVMNRHTFGFLFSVDFASPDTRDHMRTMIGDVVVGWATRR